MAYNFKVKAVYSFSTYAPNILGLQHKDLTLAAILDYDSAKNFTDVDKNHQLIYPLIPVEAGIPNKRADYQYLLFRSTDNLTKVIAYPWINESTIVENYTGSVRLVVGGTKPGDDVTIRSILRQAGFTSVAIEQN